LPLETKTKNVFLKFSKHRGGQAPHSDAHDVCHIFFKYKQIGKIALMRTIPQNPMTKILMSSGIYIHIKTIPRTLKFGKH